MENKKYEQIEKRKYDLKKYAHDFPEVKMTLDDMEITAFQRIPYKEKENMAIEMATRVVMTHDDSCAYEGSEYNKVLALMIAKYYTSIDTTDADEYDIVDFMLNTGVYNWVVRAIEDDLGVVIDIYNAIVHSVVITYNDDRGLTKAIRTSFSFLFNGEDITQSIAKAEAMKDTVYNAINALREKEKDAEETIDDGKMRVGGNILSFAKKEQPE